jgi:glycosyltransferase involved in cell wall biosynthesis
MNRPTVTVVVIAQNEAPRLRLLIPQLTSWADEVLILDGGSQDDTAAVSRSLGATVVERAFDNFAAQRNAALTATKSDWLLYLDADERPTTRFVAELQRRLANERFAAYRTPIRSSIFGRSFRFSGTQDDVPLRLVRRDAGRWCGAVHEKFAARGAIARFESYLEHETLPTPAAFLAKMKRYTDLAAAASAARDETPSLIQLALRPAREVFRRLVWKHGWLDGPRGWQFCLLSGYSEWVLVQKQRQAGRVTSHNSVDRPALATAICGGGAA